jgi:hypothetical protein
MPVRALSLPNVALLLAELGETKVGGGDTGVSGVFGAGLLKVGMYVCEVVAGVEGESHLLTMGGRGGMSSFPTDDETPSPRIIAFSELPKELRFRRRSFSFGLALVSAALESLLESIP